jgi:localization factor PodJL
MNSRVSWSADGIDPSVRERAEAAARRAGMSLSDWLNSTLGDTAPPNYRNGAPQQPAPAQKPDVADIHQRLDSITRQIERISDPAPRSDTSREQGVARQLNDAISRLDARLSQISNPQAARTAQNKQQRQTEAVERAASQVYSAPVQTPQAFGSPQRTHDAPQALRNAPPLSPASLDFAVAEIAARQNELDAPPPRSMPPRSAPPIAPQWTPPPPQPAPQQYTPPPAPAPAPDFSALEKHLFKITSQIEALQSRPDVEQSIAAFRTELAEIRAAITEAMPRRAIETIENEIRTLSRRIDESRQGGIDEQVLGNIENALNEIRDVLRSLKSAEQLAGYDEAIRNLGAKLDMILRANDDPGTVRQLENAIAALRGIVSNVASNDALVRLSDDVQMLSSKIEQIAHSSSNNDSFVALENRIAMLTAALENRERPQSSDNSEQIEGALRALSDRIDRMQVGNDSASAFAHLEQRVSYLLERLESSHDQRSTPSPDIGRVENGLQDILRHLEGQHAALANFADNQHAAIAQLANSQSRPAPEPRDDELADLVKRELSDIRFSQTKTDRQTQESLETVNSTLGHVVDRLAMIEGDLRAVRSAPAPQPPAYTPEPEVASPRVAMTPQIRPELPNPAATQETPFAAPAPAPHFAAAPREFHAAEPDASPAAAAPPTVPLAISEILVPTSSPRPALAPDLPPDHPLEPGTRPSGRAASPSERIAASENAISEIPAASKEPVSSSSFIAAARRAAQAAAAQPPVDRAKAAKVDKAKDKAKLKDAAKVAAKPGKDGAKTPSTVTSKIRSLLVGASVVVIVLGTFKMAMNLLDGGMPSIPGLEKPAEPSTLTPSDSSAKPAAPEQPAAAPAITAPPPAGRQSLNNAAPATSGAAASVTIPQIPQAPQMPQVPAPATSGNDITGAIPPSSRQAALVQLPQGERLPDAIGGPNLRAAALRGDAAAAYEVGVRFAEGKGVAQNIEEAAKWYDRAAQAGIIPAIFRLGTLYEKGMGVKKDPDLARRYYVQAAERGNAKAMHNLAVLDADGGGQGPNYKSAAQWFRKAADRGVADSEFNLGILYARGIGVEQNLAESFKWFSLAAAQGDADAARKRDDIAKRLDAQSLAAAKLAIQTFTPEPQPDDAVNAATPPGGWDSAPTAAAPAAARPAAKPATKRAAAATPHL